MSQSKLTSTENSLTKTKLKSKLFVFTEIQLQQMSPLI